MTKYDKLEEPEIINPGGKGQIDTSYQTRYTEETRNTSPAVFVLSLIAFFLSLIPFIGVGLAIAAMIFAKIKHTSMILAVIAFIISCVSTTLFMLLAIVLKWIF